MHDKRMYILNMNTLEKNKLLFSAVVEFADDNSNETFDVEIDKSIETLTYDEVESAIYDAVDNKHGYVEEDFEDDVAPYKIVDLVVNDNGESYPVVPEDADLKKLDKELDIEKYLVLPWARYSLTPECKLWIIMKDNDLIDENEPFDFKTYHDLIEAMNEKK